ncbi:MAG: hypothetical protein R3B82_15710 [Sandaracinaceae bacterium]
MAEEPAAPSSPTNDCPPHVQCHSVWHACHCVQDERGELARMEADFDGDGTPDLRITYDYDEQGNLLRWNHDQGADGTIELPAPSRRPALPTRTTTATATARPAT